ncbi:MAG: hypothetical protein ACK4OM_02305 [Alphaproteobacteria bacterium]
MSKENTDNNNSQTTDKSATIKENINSVGGFFSLSYAVILIVSISYNVGYFKFINPQIVDLMTLSDYVNNTLHNVWLFLIPVILFYSGSLAYIKKKLGSHFTQFVLLGITVLLIALYAFLKGSSRATIWPVLESFIGEIYITPIIAISIILIPVIIAYAIYKFSSAFLKDKLPQYTISIFPIIIFILLVFIPYIGGLLQGKLETQNFGNSKYKCHSISITHFNKQILENVYILKHVEKGLIVRHFLDSDDDYAKSEFLFINWSDIVKISYDNPSCK